MRTLGTTSHVRHSRVTPAYAGALIIATISGFCALFALAAGSPLQFGVALALCGGGWIAADFVERTARRARRGSALAGDPCRVVYIGHRERLSSPAPRLDTRAVA